MIADFSLLIEKKAREEWVFAVRYAEVATADQDSVTPGDVADGEVLELGGGLQEAIAAKLADVHRSVVGGEEGSDTRPAEDGGDIASGVHAGDWLRCSRLIVIDEELASVCGFRDEVMEEGAGRGYRVCLAVVEQAGAAAFADEL